MARPPPSDVPVADPPAAPEHAAHAAAQTLLAGLALLQAGQPREWRCLRALAEFPDFPHLARRLHLSQAELQTLLDTLAQRLGAQHLHVSQGRVQASAPLLQAIAQAQGGAGPFPPFPRPPSRS